MAPSSVEQRKWPRSPAADQAPVLHQPAQHAGHLHGAGDFGSAHQEHALLCVLVPRVDGGFREVEPLPRGVRHRAGQVSLRHYFPIAIGGLEAVF